MPLPSAMADGKVPDSCSEMASRVENDLMKRTSKFRSSVKKTVAPASLSTAKRVKKIASKSD